MSHPGPHEPAWQMSPAPQLVPSGNEGCVHEPVASHTSEVQGLPSSGHAVPLGWSTMVQPPRPSHVELTSQLVAVHVYGVPPQAPAVHTSVDVQALPSLQVVPSGAL